MKRFIYITHIILLVSCHASHINMGMAEDQAPVIIYTTKGDYYYNVPVILNEAKDKIVAYPAPSDLLYEGELVLPIKLINGYLLDRRGINVNTAFTSYTYKEYAALTTAPPLDKLYNSILDNDPLESIYHVGKKADFRNLEKELNKRIKAGLK